MLPHHIYYQLPLWRADHRLMRTIQAAEERCRHSTRTLQGHDPIDLIRPTSPHTK